MSATIQAWGLTGGIASGKSTVARLFASEGFRIIDADQIARELSAPGGAAHGAIVKKFGTSERAALRELIFRDAHARQDLEAILHPEISRVVELKIAELRAENEAPILYEASLLVETGRYRDLRGLVTVSAPEQLRLTRLTARDPSSAGVAAHIISNQISDAAREKVADFVIKNDGTLERLLTEVKKIARKINPPH